jgi:hypothetical protein
LGQEAHRRAGTNRYACQTSLETGLSNSSPHEAVRSSPRPPHKTAAPQDKGQAGVTPHGLGRDCPAPREDSVSGNITATRRKRSGRRGRDQESEGGLAPA